MSLFTVTQNQLLRKVSLGLKMECKLCSSKKIRPLFVAGDTHGRKELSTAKFMIYECSDCNVAYTNININENYYQQYYLKDYYIEETKNPFLKTISNLIFRLSIARQLKLIKKFKPKGNKILEIGCAKGDVLNALPDIYEKYGVEINQDATRYIKEHYSDIKIYNRKIDDPKFKCTVKFDVIIMWHVLEHIDDPYSFFKSIIKLLSDDGVIIFEIPNRDSLGFNFTKSCWFHIDAPRHLFFYNYRCLDKVLKKYGLKINRYLGDPIDYFQDLSMSLFKKFGSDNFFSKLFSFIFMIPSAILLRLLFSLFYPKIAEVNTYVVGRMK